MLKGNKVLPLLLIASAAGFVFGLVLLFQLRYQSGDVYPPYSSLRSDPLGSKAFFESLQRIDGVKVQRNLFYLEKLDLPRPTTVFYFGLGLEDLDEVEEAEFKKWQDIVLGGGRLVFSFEPTHVKAAPRNPFTPPPVTEKPKELDEDADEPEGMLEDERTDKQGRRGWREQEPPEFDGIKLVSPSERWGFQIAFQELPKDQEDNYEPVEVQRAALAPVPASLWWHTSMVFSELAAEWQTLYSRAGQPVLIERRLGRGSIVLASDSYLLSNEAMRADRQPEVLAWLVGGSQSVVFDETHFGVIEKPGVMMLAKKYRLHGLFAGLALLAALFVWKNAAAFGSEPDQNKSANSVEFVGGRDSTAGFVNMLRRSVPTADVANVCFQQWKAAHSHEKLRGKLERMEAIVEAEKRRSNRERNPVSTYQRLAHIWNERKV